MRRIVPGASSEYRLPSRHRPRHGVEESEGRRRSVSTSLRCCATPSPNRSPAHPDALERDRVRAGLSVREPRSPGGCGISPPEYRGSRSPAQSAGTDVDGDGEVEVADQTFAFGSRGDVRSELRRPSRDARVTLRFRSPSAHASTPPSLTPGCLRRGGCEPSFAESAVHFTRPPRNRVVAPHERGLTSSSQVGRLVLCRVPRHLPRLRVGVRRRDLVVALPGVCLASLLFGGLARSCSWSPAVGPCIGPDDHLPGPRGLHPQGVGHEPGRCVTPALVDRLARTGGRLLLKSSSPYLPPTLTPWGRTILDGSRTRPPRCAARIFSQCPQRSQRAGCVAGSRRERRAGVRSSAEGKTGCPAPRVPSNPRPPPSCR